MGRPQDTHTYRSSNLRHFLETNLDLVNQSCLTMSERQQASGQPQLVVLKAPNRASTNQMLDSITFI